MPITVANFVRQRGRGGKFVVLVTEGGGEDWFVLSDFSLDSQHRDIVERWLSGRGASLSSLGLTTYGGGWWKYHPDTNRLELYGTSAAYGRYDATWLEQRLAPGSVFGEKDIVME